MIRERLGRVLGLGGETSHPDGRKEKEVKSETAKCLLLIQQRRVQSCVYMRNRPVFELISGCLDEC